MGEATHRKGMSLPMKIVLGMILGAIVGTIVGPDISVIGFVGTIFMRLLRMCIYPLVFFSILCGVSNVADIRRLRKVGFWFLLYTVVTTGIAAVIGVTLSTITDVGRDFPVPPGQELVVSRHEGLAGSFINWIPDNPFAALSNGNLLQIIVFSLIVGIVIASLKDTRHGVTIRELLDSLNEVMTKTVGWVIRLAPYGVFSLMAVMVGTTGIEMIGSAAKMLGVYYVSISLCVFIMLPFFLKFIAGVSPVQHFKNIYPVMVMAASTCSSVGTLPVTMNSAKYRCGVPEDIVDMVSAPAATINMNAGGVEFSLYVLFAAHMYGIDFSILQISFLIILCIVMSMGAAGVPGGGIMMCAISMGIMGVPEDIIVPLVAGMYTLIDIGATTLNVTSDTVGMVTIASRLGELDKTVFYADNKA
ncbi:MAG: dicarboxylate/amino acid:cation symporter [Planctomycetaceae bacterium]|nr:dicarboxylate/amino acid:cation symporter [Planctomycetaceae bacterium]